MNFRKIITTLLALVLVLAFSSCQLSEYIDKKDTAAESGTDTEEQSSGSGDTSAEAPSTDPYDYIPEGVDIDYSMDYMNEDLTAYLTLGEYKNIAVEVATYVVDDEYIDEQIKALLDSEAAPAQITDRKTAEGDVICVDYTGTLDGVAFSGGSATNVSITLSEDSGYIPGFVDGMYDVMPGETVSYEVTFPDEYSNNPDLAGKLTVFTVTVHYIEGEDVAPELTDEFVVEKFGSEGVETVEQFMEYYADYLEEERIAASKEDASLQIWDVIMENAAVIELPQKAVDALYWMNRATYEAYAAQYGMDYETFMSSYVGMTDEDLVAYSEDYIKEDLVIYSIVKAEGIEITDEELAEGIATYCEEYEMTEDELISEYGEERIEAVLQWQKLMTSVYDWNTVTEVVE